MKYKPYPVYKESGVEWLGKIPAHWEVQRLKHIAEMNKSVLPETAPPELAFRYVDISAVDSLGRVVAIEDMVFGKAPSRARRLAFAGDTVFSTVRTYLRAIAQAPDRVEDIVFSTGFAVLHPRPPIDPRFFCRALQAEPFIQRVVANSEGVGYPAISPSKLATLPVVLPRAEEQRIIAAFLDRETAKIDALIAKKERLIELLQEKRAALITRAVTKGLDPNVPMKDSGVRWIGQIPAHWKIKRLKWLTSRVDVGIAEAATHAYVDDGVPIIRSTNVKPNCIERDDLLQIEKWFAEKNRSKYLDAGDLVTVRTGNPGTTAVVPPELSGSQCFTLLISTPRKGQVPEFLCNWLNSQGGRVYFELEGWGSAQTNISVPILQNLPCSEPPLDEQSGIVTCIGREALGIDRLVEQAGRAIDRLKEYRMALISAAVTGKIDVRDAAV